MSLTAFGVASKVYAWYVLVIEEEKVSHFC